MCVSTFADAHHLKSQSCFGVRLEQLWYIYISSNRLKIAYPFWKYLKNTICSFLINCASKNIFVILFIIWNYKL